MASIRQAPLFRGTPVVVDYAPGIADPAAIHASIVRLVERADRIGLGLDDLFAVIEATTGFYGYASHATGFSTTAIDIVVDDVPRR